MGSASGCKNSANNETGEYSMSCTTRKRKSVTRRRLIPLVRHHGEVEGKRLYFLSIIEEVAALIRQELSASQPLGLESSIIHGTGL